IADVLYLRYLQNQVDPKLLEKRVVIGSKIEQDFGTYRPVIDGAAMTSNDVWRILRTSPDQELRRKAWEASKAVGPMLESGLRTLVRLRNESARVVGFRDYYEMTLVLTEHDEKELIGIFTELEKVTREPFAKVKAGLDEDIMRRFGVTAEEIMPWHYNDPYFQESPSTGGLDLDRFYEGRDIAQLAADFFASVGMPVEDILSRSDLYERDGKNPHAFTTDIDRSGDIRILANLEANSTWMETMLHELGHGIYDKYIDGDLPYLLRIYPHICTSEASSMFFGRLAQDPRWMQKALGLDEETTESISAAVTESLRIRQLVFSRWVQVMFNFERELYRDPDQDLNALWWELKEKYQFMNKPAGRDEPDYAAKIHIIASPVYYHNYMLGELIASQFLHHLGETTSTGKDLPPTSLPTEIPSPTPTMAPRTPPALPPVYTSTVLNPLDTPHTYVVDTCQYLQNKWNPNNAAPGTIVIVIMFHGINKDASDVTTNGISVVDFKKLMNALKELGFDAINATQLAD
ncbi:MAG TPA: M2 family metallopeptidase, partial [Candidatus Krumholzibacterium sp.]|nr:M2 family metallopeptidase [Candidatus Krumholzibacterium sp.]